MRRIPMQMIGPVDEVNIVIVRVIDGRRDLTRLF
jgi:hypothetical protein